MRSLKITDQDCRKTRIAKIALREMVLLALYLAAAFLVLMSG